VTIVNGLRGAKEYPKKPPIFKWMRKKDEKITGYVKRDG
jgi:hypothetical protein